MSIKTTRDITRAEAIERIKSIASLHSEKHYLEIDCLSFETNYDIQDFVDGDLPYDVFNIEKWTDKMLENVMDEPFFRHSLFDNYLIKE